METSSTHFWKGEEVLRLLRCLHPLAVRQGQLSVEQILRIAAEMLVRRPQNVLVWGLGEDAPFWLACNPWGRTAFIEDDEAWLARLRPFLPTAQLYGVTFTTRVGEWRDDVGFPLGWPDSLAGIPWDVILVDGPRGYEQGMPGRQQSIWCAAQLRTPGTRVYVHDYQRPWDRRCADAYLGAPNRMMPGAFGYLAEWCDADNSLKT